MRLTVTTLLLLAACSDTVSVASWNLQVFGDKKADNPIVLDAIIDKIKQHDIIALQEIRDNNGSSFNKLCQRLNNSGLWGCLLGKPQGRSHTKERYAVVYRTDKVSALLVSEWSDELINAYELWERPPMSVLFKTKNTVFELVIIHTKPSDASNEIKNLLRSINNGFPLLVVGDLNADCTYSDRNINTTLKVLITDDTTTGPSNCAYDRILASDSISVRDSFVDKSNVPSDHYLISATITA